MGDPQPDDTRALIDREAASDAERRDSRVLYDALRQRRDQLGGVAGIPADDRPLSERILAEARSRSAQISAARSAGATGVSGPLAPVARPIPWWLWLAWLVAIVLVALAFRYLG